MFVLRRENSCCNEHDGWSLNDFPSDSPPLCFVIGQASDDKTLKEVKMKFECITHGNLYLHLQFRWEIARITSTDFLRFSTPGGFDL